jgi:hypothetical protein
VISDKKRQAVVSYHPSLITYHLFLSVVCRRSLLLLLRDCGRADGRGRVGRGHGVGGRRDGNLRRRCAGLCGLAGGLGLCGRGLVFGVGLSNGYDLHDGVVVREQIFADGTPDLFGSDGEVTCQFGVDEERVAGLQGVFGEPLRAEERGLATAYGVVEKRVA